MITTVITPTERHTVLVLGRSASGRRLPDAQRAVLDRVEALARTARVVLDARLVSSAAAAAAFVGSEDRLVLDAGSREARRIRRRLSAPGAR